MKPQLIDADRQKIVNYLGWLWEKSVDTLKRLEGDSAATDFIESEIPTEKPSIFSKKITTHNLEGEDSGDPSPQVIMARAAVGNLKLLRHWSNVEGVEPSYLTLLAYLSGLYLMAAKGQNQVDEINPLAELGLKFEDGRKKQKKPRKPDALKEAMIDRACEIYRNTGYIPTAKELWVSIEKDLPQGIQEVVSTEDIIYWKEGDEEPDTSFRAFEKRYSRYKGEIKEKIES